MADLLELPSWDEQGRLRVVVETPKGAPFKVHYDAATLAFTYQRPLHHLRYPYDWGFVPGTLADDGDPLDALVLHGDATWPGIVLPSEPLAILKILDEKPGTERELENDRIIAVLSERPPTSRAVLSAETRRELENFFRTTGEQTGKKLRVLGWGGADQARAAIEHAKRP
ncbi:MAG TPA: inorganic diphosphatase [Polyangiaceae bacterium]|jgi:inorganic pyrophosphatase|nr:inorganic diphosphatase [Polyangiaceae bacterium]